MYLQNYVWKLKHGISQICGTVTSEKGCKWGNSSWGWQRGWGLRNRLIIVVVVMVSTTWQCWYGVNGLVVTVKTSPFSSWDWWRIGKRCNWWFTWLIVPTRLFWWFWRFGFRGKYKLLFFVIFEFPHLSTVSLFQMENCI